MYKRKKLPPAAATVAQQVQQDQVPAPLGHTARLGIGGLGAVVLAGVLHLAQMHLVFGVVRVHLYSPAGILQGIDALAQALVGQRGQIIPPGIAAGHAVQDTAGLRVTAIYNKVSGSLHLRTVAAGVAGTALRAAITAAIAKPKAEGVKAIKTAVAVLLPIALLAVSAVALLSVAAGLRSGVAAGNGIVGGLYFLKVLLCGGVVGVQVRVPALALGTVGFFYLFVTGTPLDAEYLVRISHQNILPSRLWFLPAARALTSIVYRTAHKKSRGSAALVGARQKGCALSFGKKRGDAADSPLARPTPRGKIPAGGRAVYFFFCSSAFLHWYFSQTPE